MKRAWRPWQSAPCRKPICLTDVTNAPPRISPASSYCYCHAVSVPRGVSRGTVVDVFPFFALRFSVAVLVVLVVACLFSPPPNWSTKRDHNCAYHISLSHDLRPFTFSSSMMIAQTSVPPLPRSFHLVQAWLLANLNINET